jgi:hypothetical protein
VGVGTNLFSTSGEGDSNRIRPLRTCFWRLYITAPEKARMEPAKKDEVTASMMRVCEGMTEARTVISPVRRVE